MMRSSCHLVGRCMKTHVVGMRGGMEQTRYSMVAIRRCSTATILTKQRLRIAMERYVMLSDLVGGLWKP